MTVGLPDFFRYNLWANQRLLDACEQLSDEQLDATMNGIFGSVRGTLMHLFSSEEGYARSLTGEAPTPRLDETASFPGFVGGETDRFYGKGRTGSDPLARWRDI